MNPADSRGLLLFVELFEFKIHLCWFQKCLTIKILRIYHENMISITELQRTDPEYLKNAKSEHLIDWSFPNMTKEIGLQILSQFSWHLEHIGFRENFNTLFLNCFKSLTLKQNLVIRTILFIFGEITYYFWTKNQKLFCVGNTDSV